VKKVDNKWDVAINCFHITDKKGKPFKEQSIRKASGKMYETITRIEKAVNLIRNDKKNSLKSIHSKK
jgi:hypothetical protein